MMEIAEALKVFFSFGINKYEYHVYKTLLLGGKLTSLQISNTTGIPYGKVYEVINGLVNFGLACRIPSKPTMFEVISPRKSIDLLKERKLEALKEVDKVVNEIIQPAYESVHVESTQVKDKVFLSNGRSSSNIEIGIAIESAKEEIRIYCSLKSLVRMMWFKEQLVTAKVEINIFVSSKEKIPDELLKIDWCTITKIRKEIKNLYFFVDNKHGLFIRPMPDDDSYVRGNDFIIKIKSESFITDFEIMFNHNVKNKKEVKE